MFCDAALQNIGYIVLGTAIKRHPELNRPELYPKVEFSDKHNDKLDKYNIISRYVGGCNIHKLIEQFDKLVDNTALVVGELANDKHNKIVAGTLRMMVDIGTVGGINLLTFDIIAILEKQ